MAYANPFSFANLKIETPTLCGLSFGCKAMAGDSVVKPWLGIRL